MLAQLKAQIRTAQVRAALAVNSELVLLYWNIGERILEHQNSEGWGKSVIPRLSKDLCSEFPRMKGLTPRNLGYMKSFAEAWPDEPILQQTAAKLPWFNNCIILDKLKTPHERLWYAQATIEHGWSRNVLVMQIESGLYKRQGKAISNFSKAFPARNPTSRSRSSKDPYNFDFLTLAKDAHERDIEEGLLAHLRRFLIELGSGFAFVGSQYPLEVAGKDYRLDLLLYHLKLRCYVIIDLKGGRVPAGVHRIGTVRRFKGSQSR